LADDTVDRTDVWRKIHKNGRPSSGIIRPVRKQEMTSNERLIRDIYDAFNRKHVARMHRSPSRLPPDVLRVC